jgi:hypothetical protein
MDRLGEAMMYWHERALAAEAGWERECDDTDKLLRALGLSPDACRTDGGSLMVAKVATALLGDAK